jgi:hypothetical protein
MLPDDPFSTYILNISGRRFSECSEKLGRRKKINNIK